MYKPTQREIIKKRLEYYLDFGIKDKSDIYARVVTDLKLPRPTIRRVARELVKDYQNNIEVLNSKVKPGLIPKSTTTLEEAEKISDLIEQNIMIAKDNNLELTESNFIWDEYNPVIEQALHDNIVTNNLKRFYKKLETASNKSTDATNTISVDKVLNWIDLCFETNHNFIKQEIAIEQLEQ